VPLDDSINRATALLAGRIDAAVIEFVEFMRIDYQQPGFEILGSMKDISPFPVNTVFVVTGEFAEQNRELLGEVVSGLLAGYEILYGPDGKREWTELASATQLEGEEPALVARVYDFYRDLGFWPRRARPVPQADYERGVEFWLENGQIEVSVAFEDVWDLAAWQAAAGRG
jgi:ABC-type nitrate/sulfonate/bicarbonate transport system substrate-binding protein